MAAYFYCNPELTTGAANGTSWANAWKTFAGIGWATLATSASSTPTYLYIKKGTMSRALLQSGGTGSSDTNRIIITTDPTDTGIDPIIRVSTVLSDWTEVGGGIYSCQPTGWARDALQCWEDVNTPMKKGASAVLTAGYFWIDTSTTPDTVYVHCTDSADPATHTIELSNSDKALYILHHYVTAENLTLQHGDDTTFGGCRILNAIMPVVRNCEIGPCSGGLILLGKDGVIEDNYFHHVWNGKVYGSGGAGTALYYDMRYATNVSHTIRRNTFSLNYQHMADFPSDWVGTAQIYHNILDRALVNGINFIRCTAANRPTIINNIVYHKTDGTVYLPNSSHGMALQEATSTDRGIIVKNNIFIIDNTSTAQGILLSRADYEAVDIDNNLYHFLDSGGVCGAIGATTYATLALWQAALVAASYSGAEAHGVSADPQIVNLLGGDYHIKSTSPCRNAGVDVGLTTDYYGNPVPERSRIVIDSDIHTAQRKTKANPAIGIAEYVPGVSIDIEE